MLVRIKVTQNAAVTKRGQAEFLEEILKEKVTLRIRRMVST